MAKNFRRNDSAYGKGIDEGVTTLNIPAPEGLVTGLSGGAQGFTVAGVLNMLRQSNNTTVSASICNKHVRSFRVTSATFDCSPNVSSPTGEFARCRITVSGGVGKFYSNELKPIKVQIPKSALVGMWQPLNDAATALVDTDLAQSPIIEWLNAELVSVNVAVVLDPESTTA